MFDACASPERSFSLFLTRTLHVPDVYMKNASLDIDLYAAAIVKK